MVLSSKDMFKMGFSLLWMGQTFKWNLEGADGSSMSLEVYLPRPKGWGEVLQGLTHRAATEWCSTRRGLAVSILRGQSQKRRIPPEEDAACCRLPSTYSIYDPDGCFIGASDEVVRSAARLRSLASGFSDRLLLMSGAEGRFKELSKLVNNEAQLHHSR